MGSAAEANVDRPQNRQRQRWLSREINREQEPEWLQPLFECLEISFDCRKMIRNELGIFVIKVLLV